VRDDEFRQAEMAELMANPNKNAVGTVIEAYLDKARGPTATVLVQGGTLRMGDVMLVGATYGKVRGQPVPRHSVSATVS
jgi:translation initiation factor IF-2